MKKPHFFIQLMFLFTSLIPILPSQPGVQAADSQDIWIITDLHYLSPSLHDKTGEAINHIRNTGAGKDFDYGPQRMEALIYWVEEDQPDYLVVSGDLTLNGELASMQDLAAYFDRIEALGTQVLVTPGNHDIASGWARAFQGEDFIKTDQVMAEDFAALFKAHGFDQALSRDPHSLSYVYALDPQTWVIMLDSNIYADGQGKGQPITKGRLKPETMVWLSDRLAEADQAGVKVIPVSHHNSLDHHERLKANYTLENAVDYRALLAKYQVPLTLSGHIHTQHIASLTQGDWALTDIVTGAFSSAPSYVGKLKVTPQGLSYQAEPLDLVTWAKAEQTDDPNLLDYPSYIAETFNKASRQMAYGEMIESGWYQKDDPFLDQIADYVALVNLAYFSGHPLQEKDLAAFENLADIRDTIDQKAFYRFKAYIEAVEASQTDHRYLDLVPWPNPLP